MQTNDCMYVNRCKQWLLHFCSYLFLSISLMNPSPEWVLISSLLIYGVELPSDFLAY